jgi:HEPN domain-containing protein
VSLQQHKQFSGGLESSISDHHVRACVIDFFDRSFRDVADADYVSARVCHRLGLERQFLWASLQAIEKYLKGILLYNDQNAKNLGHQIGEAYVRLKLIRDIQFDIPKDVEDFIGYLNEQGPNRYFAYPSVTRGNELLVLDKSVWHLRRYCQFFRRESSRLNGTIVNWFKAELNHVHDPRYKQKPNQFGIVSGHLEKILDQKKSELRRELIWKNFYYGTYKKKTIRKVISRSSSGNPTHYLHPEIFQELAKRVQFSKDVIDYFNRKKTLPLSEP